MLCCIIEGSLEAKLPTIWTDGNAQAGKKIRHEESQKGEDKRWRKSEKRSCRLGAKKNPDFFQSRDKQNCLRTKTRDSNSGSRDWHRAFVFDGFVEWPMR